MSLPSVYPMGPYPCPTLLLPSISTLPSLPLLTISSVSLTHLWSHCGLMFVLGTEVVTEHKGGHLL